MRKTSAGTQSGIPRWTVVDYFHYGLWLLHVREYPPDIYVSELIDDLEDDAVTTILTEP
jgi:hypothetical protein